MKHQTPMAELTRMSRDELRRDLHLKHAQAAKMRMGLEMQSEKNSGLYRAHRRGIARMTMVLRRMERSPKSPTQSTMKNPLDSSASSESSRKASQSVEKPVK